MFPGKYFEFLHVSSPKVVFSAFVALLLCGIVVMISLSDGVEQQSVKHNSPKRKLWLFSCLYMQLYGTCTRDRPIYRSIDIIDQYLTF